MKTTIGVFFGGRSTEHEISIISANQAINALDTEKYSIVPVYVTKDGRWLTGDALLDLASFRDMNALKQRTEEVYMRPIEGDYNLYLTNPKGMFGRRNTAARLDVILPVFHGANGEDGTFQGILQAIDIPFVGCDTLASANGMDKITMKMILAQSNIPVVEYRWFTDRQWHADRDAIISSIEDGIGYPVIVKPANLGSSIGISPAHNREELLKAVADATQYASRIIVERMIMELQEINCSVLGDCDDHQTSVLEEPLKTTEILSYTDKYLGGTKGTQGMQASQKKIPADLPADLTAEIQRMSAETFRVLSCNGVARVDTIIDRATGKPYVNEINTIPGSLSFYLWEATGITFPQLMDKLISLAIRRYQQSQRKTTSFTQNIFALSGGAGTKGVKGVKGAKA